jgi:hypothetical protein
MQVKAETTIRVPPGTPLILTFEQAKAREHLLKFNVPVCLAFGPEDYQEDAIATSNQSLEFKRGEVLEVSVIPKGWAGKISILEKRNPEEESHGLQAEEANPEAPEREAITPESETIGADVPAPMEEGKAAASPESKNGKSDKKAK